MRMSVAACSHGCSGRTHRPGQQISPVNASGGAADRSGVEGLPAQTLGGSMRIGAPRRRLKTQSDPMPVFVLRLKAPRPRLQTLTDAERQIMARHGAHWRPNLEQGDIVAFGPVLTDEDSYGLAVVETDDEQALRDFAAEDS